MELKHAQRLDTGTDPAAIGWTFSDGAIPVHVLHRLDTGHFNAILFASSDPDAPAELVRRVNAYPALVSALHACLAELRAELANDPDATLIAAAIKEAEAALTAAWEG